ncbi:unnamed protein product [Lymnaea stagnalis]|uniref:AIG1-type G domain-containing protein n=1 Tax=Lymnaea stagnalis TaxID=6523 RepID=A0AAV2HBX1_LYMST
MTFTDRSKSLAVADVEMEQRDVVQFYCKPLAISEKQNNHSSMMQSSDVDLLLIGKTGHGKSATGNAILRRRAFKTSGNASSETQKIDYEVSDYNGRILKIVDGPGIGDTRMTTDSAVQIVLNATAEAIATNPKGYHAFLLVVKYGQRFTGEEQETIGFLKNIFGDTFVKEFCILLMSNGDTFEKESKEIGQTFEDWCGSQTGAFKSLLSECNNRIVLFNNSTKDEDIIDKQLRQLLSVVERLSSKGQRYTDKNFEAAKDARMRVLVDAQEPLIRDETMQETSLILQNLEQIQACDHFETKLNLLEKLLVRAESLFESISTLDRGTGALHEIVQMVKSIKSTISDEIKFTIRNQEESQRMKKIEEELKKKADEETEIIRQHFELILNQERLAHQQEVEILRQQEKTNKDLERKMNTKIEQGIKEHLKQFEKRRLKQEHKMENLEKQYRQTKEKNDRSILNMMLSGITWPFRKIASLFS